MTYHDREEDETLRYLLTIYEGDKMCTDPEEVFHALGYSKSEILEWFFDNLIGSVDHVGDRFQRAVEELQQEYIDFLVNEETQI